MKRNDGIRQLPTGKWEITINHKLLPGSGRVFRTVDDEEYATAYKKNALRQLDRGIIPVELTRVAVKQAQRQVVEVRPKPAAPKLATRSTAVSPDIVQVLADYEIADTAQISASDKPMVVSLQGQLKGRIDGLTTPWVDAWIRTMKRVDKIAPGTIRKKVECLARAVDWYNRKTYPTGSAPANPLRLLPVGYSNYTDSDVAPGQALKTDVSRDRRLENGEDDKIELVLGGWKKPEKERAWTKVADEDFRLLYRVIVNTALRLREAYTLEIERIRFDLHTIHIPLSKTGKARDVPMTAVVEAWLKAYVGDRKAGPLFPFWQGSRDEDVLKAATLRLSRRFATLFDNAGCADLTEHDLRHEATCRWMLMRDEEGRFLFRPEEVRRITGHKNVQMFERYLSLRGSDLAERLH